eukprot:160041-Chlamydomonas_euryale.AAC.3
MQHAPANVLPFASRLKPWLAVTALRCACARHAHCLRRPRIIPRHPVGGRGARMLVGGSPFSSMRPRLKPVPSCLASAAAAAADPVQQLLPREHGAGCSSARLARASVAGGAARTRRQEWLAQAVFGRQR